jgi:hypothetical protein
MEITRPLRIYLRFQTQIKGIRYNVLKNYLR